MKLTAVLIFLFTVHAITPVMALECQPLSQSKEIAPNLSESKFLTALTKANIITEKWLEEKSKSLRNSSENEVLYGPNLDGTYFYRLGPHAVTERFSFGAALKQQRDKLLRFGFPSYQPSEAASIGFINNQARAKATPTSIRCMKHFPGGNEDTELTEAEPVKFFDFSLFKKMHEPFVSILKTSNAPTCIMMGHAQFKPEFMNQQSDQDLDIFGTKKFEEVPASLNPGITRYLRTNLNFDGLLIADWYDMGAINQFIKNLNSPYPSNFVIMYLATIAGMDFIPIDQSGSSILHDAKNGVDGQPVPQFILTDLDRKLNQSVFETLRRIHAPKTMEFIKNLPLSVKLEIKLTPTVEPVEVSRVSSDLYDKLYRYHMGADIWNRTGVMVLLQRQIAIELLLNGDGKLHQSFGRPNTIQSETQWFKKLMSNQNFRQTYDKINWNSTEVQNLFCHVRKNNFSL